MKTGDKFIHCGKNIYTVDYFTTETGEQFETLTECKATNPAIIGIKTKEQKQGVCELSFCEPLKDNQQ